MNTEYELYSWCCAACSWARRCWEPWCSLISASTRWCLRRYCPARSGRVAANELGPLNIRVNAVQPGMTHTGATAGAFTNAPMMQQFLDKARRDGCLAGTSQADETEHPSETVSPGGAKCIQLRFAPDEVGRRR